MADEKKVLVAEDSSVIQTLVKRVLQMQSFKIYAAKNGKKVIEMLQKEPFDIILMDINMPVMDGMECARQIRALEDEKIKNTPIIAITGNAQNYTIDQFKDAGINEYLPKPLNFDRLVDIVQEYTKD